MTHSMGRVLPTLNTLGGFPSLSFIMLLVFTALIFEQWLRHFTMKTHELYCKIHCEAAVQLGVIHCPVGIALSVSS